MYAALNPAKDLYLNCKLRLPAPFHDRFCHGRHEHFIVLDYFVPDFSETSYHGVIHAAEIDCGIVV